MRWIDPSTMAPTIWSTELSGVQPGAYADLEGFGGGGKARNVGHYVESGDRNARLFWQERQEISPFEPSAAHT